MPVLDQSHVGILISNYNIDSVYCIVYICIVYTVYYTLLLYMYTIYYILYIWEWVGITLIITYTIFLCIT